jgi:acetoin utilization deacetylase AcuC-like enzyme/formylglycine-generating enzyme required for sulfatase activity
LSFVIRALSFFRHSSFVLRHSAFVAACALACFAGGCQRVDPAPAIPEAAVPAGITTPSGAEMVLIPAGRFRMGSSSGTADEAPPHEVTLEAFWIDRYEVTQEQYGRLVRGNPSHFKGPRRPMEQISWADAALYCNVRSRAEGLEPCYNEETAACNFAANGYRLPAEAEWEYACRAGSDTECYFGRDTGSLGDYAWYADNADKQTHPVGDKKPNRWGLYDMYGNVAEWCNDVYAADYYGTSPSQNPTGPADGERYVLRGGAWNSSAKSCRSSARAGENPGFQDACFARNAIGFRCVRRNVEESKSPRVEESGKEEVEKSKSRRVEKSEKPDAEGAKDRGGDGVKGTTTSAVPRATQPPANPTVRSSDSSTLGLFDLSTFRLFDSLALRLSAPGGAGSPRTGFVYGEVFLRHVTGPGHPERPARLTAIVERLKQAGLWGQLTLIPPAAADRPWLTSVHAPEYLDRLERSCREGADYVDSRDTPVCAESYEAALTAAGGVMTAVDAVATGKVRNAFCAVRPPGHHSLRDRAMGFCLLNNTAIAARYAQRRHKLQKVLIVDWDVHHGNGTQAAFYEDPSVMYFSVHRNRFYPGTGSAAETGAGPGLNCTINVPLPAGSGDREYEQAFREQLQPAAARFRPDLVLVSAGFDAHEDDPLGGMKVTVRQYAAQARMVKQIAAAYAQGRLIAVLEGGYDLTGLAASVEAVVRVLME